MSDRRLDRIPHFDERSRQYPMRALLPSPAETLARRTLSVWRPGPILDQGQEGACVGFGWAQEALMSPVRVNLSGPGAYYGVSDPNEVARRFYRDARAIDRDMGNDWPEGASVLAGVKVMQRFGYVLEYRWCFDITDVIQTLIHHGPVVLGIPWHNSMYTPDEVGELFLDGRVVGGHCIAASGYHPAKVLGDREARTMIQLTNSWGEGWGLGGQAWIGVQSLAALLADQGEACVPVHRSYGRRIG